MADDPKRSFLLWRLRGALFLVRNGYGPLQAWQHMADLREPYFDDGYEPAAAAIEDASYG